jgi:hypothetical protein
MITRITPTRYVNDPDTRTGVEIAINPSVGYQTFQKDELPALQQESDTPGYHINVVVGDRNIYLNVREDGSADLSYYDKAGGYYVNIAEIAPVVKPAPVFTFEESSPLFGCDVCGDVPEDGVEILRVVRNGEGTGNDLCRACIRGIAAALDEEAA